MLSQHSTARSDETARGRLWCKSSFFKHQGSSIETTGRDQVVPHMNQFYYPSRRQANKSEGFSFHHLGAILRGGYQRDGRESFSAASSECTELRACKIANATKQVIIAGEQFRTTVLLAHLRCTYNCFRAARRDCPETVSAASRMIFDESNHSRQQLVLLFGLHESKPAGITATLPLTEMLTDCWSMA